MQDLIIEYKNALKDVKKMYRQLSAVADSLLTVEQNSDKKIIGGMISDIEYNRMAAERKTPGARRGADRRDAYKRTILSDPRLIDALTEEYAIVQGPDGEASDWNRERIAIFLY